MRFGIIGTRREIHYVRHGVISGTGGREVHLVNCSGSARMGHDTRHSIPLFHLNGGLPQRCCGAVARHLSKQFPYCRRYVRDRRRRPD